MNSLALCQIFDQDAVHKQAEIDLRDKTMEAIHLGQITPHEIAHIPLKYLDLTRLPGVPSNNILTPSKAYKPFRYEFGYKTFLEQNEVMWLPTEVPMNEDKRDWAVKLNDFDRSLMSNIFPLFVQSDTLIQNAYLSQYAKIFKPNEIQMAIAGIANMEGIHQAAYAHLLDSLSFPESHYSAFLEYKEMSDKYDYTAGFRMDTLQGIARAMVMFGGMTEGVQLFATFAIMMNYTRFNKLKGMGQVVAWSVRDETFHIKFVAQLFSYFMQEFGHLIDRNTLVDAVNTGTRDIVRHELRFSDMAFSMGPIEGLTLEQHHVFITAIADMRLKQFGFEPIFGEPEHSYEWFNAMIGGIEHMNFFEGRPSEYSRNATTGDWGDAWSKIDSNRQKLVTVD